MNHRQTRVRLKDGTIRDLADGELVPHGATLMSSLVEGRGTLDSRRRSASAR
jgi:hypothetical protein